MTDQALGDPLVPQPGDPQTMTLRVDARDVQAIVAGLSELKAGVSRRTLNSIEEQVRAVVLEARMQKRAAQQERDDERKAKADERRRRRQARHARVNGSPPPEPTTPQ